MLCCAWCTFCLISSGTIGTLCGSLVESGGVDGRCDAATFGTAITGLVYNNQRLFVTDRDNNAVRVIAMQPYSAPFGTTAWIEGKIV